MKLCLSILWSVASVLLIYSAIKYSYQYHFISLNIKAIINALKSKSKNNITPLSSLCLSLAAKIGVGSLSGIAIAIYFGGVGTIFWLIVISVFLAINTYIECELGIKYRIKIGDRYLGGPSYYINKCLNKKYLSYLYSFIVITSYSILFLSIQTNTIISTISSFNISKCYSTIILFIIVLIIILKGIKGISKVNTIIVPIMLGIYLIIGIYITINNLNILPNIIINTIKGAFNLKSIIPVFIIGLERAIFITETSIGTSAIAASTCDNDSQSQGLLEVLGIYITIFIVALTTYIIIVTSDYEAINFISKNGIDLVIYAFSYHFGTKGIMIISLITILFAFSTIISSYYFGESNLIFISKNKIIKLIYQIIFLSIILLSIYFKPLLLWHLTDYALALLIIINISSILKIKK